MENEKDVIVHVCVGDEEIRTTKEHPFYVEGMGFVMAGSLKEGDVLRLADGRTVEVSGIETEQLSEPVYVYNLEVEDYHMYFVSELGVLVHNNCGPGTGNAGGSFSTANNYGIDMDNLNFSNTVQNHTGRPYQDSKLLINEIIESKPPVSALCGTNALSWTVEGTFNGSTGYYELIIDTESNTVWHFVYKTQ